MTSGFFMGVIWLPLLAGLWVGVIGLAKAGRGGAWWTMLSGLVMVSLGLIVMTVGSVVLVRSIGSSPSGGASFDRMMIFTMGSSLALMLGLLLFSIGFALHGFKARRGRERIGELEMLISAQNEQLARYEGGPKA